MNAHYSRRVARRGQARSFRAIALFGAMLSCVALARAEDPGGGSDLLSAAEAALTPARSLGGATERRLAVLDEIGRLDLGSALRVIATPPGQKGQIAFETARRPRGWRERIVTDAGSLPAIPGSRRISFEVVPPSSSRGNYILENRARVRLGKVPPETFGRLLAGSLERLHAAACREPPGKRSLRDALRAESPQTFDFATEYLEVERVGRCEQGTLVLDLHLRWRFDRLRRDAPALAEWLEPLAERIEWSRVLLDGRSGESLAESRYDANRRRVWILVRSRDGTLVSRGGEDPGWDPSRPGARRLRSESRIMLRDAGLRVRFDDLETEIDVSLDRESARWQERFVRAPKVARVDGALFGIVPIWLLDAFSGGQASALPGRLLAAAAEGRGGQGAVGSFRFDLEDGRGTTFEAFSASEVLNDARLRAAASWTLHRYQPGPAAREDLRQLGLMLVQALRRDGALAPSTPDR